MHINNKLVIEKLLKDRYYKLSGKNMKQLVWCLGLLSIMLIISGIVFIQSAKHMHVAPRSLTLPFIMMWLIVGCSSAAKVNKEKAYFIWIFFMYTFMFFVARGKIHSPHFISPIVYPIVNELASYIGVTLILLMASILILTIRAVVILIDVQKYYLHDTRMMELLAMYNASPNDLDVKLLLSRHIDNNRGFMPICIDDLVRFVALRQQ